MKLKKAIIILLILLIMVVCIVGIIILSIKPNLNTEEVIYEKHPEENIISIVDRKNVLQQVNSNNEFYKVKNCIEKYYVNLSGKNIKAIYNILDDEYILFKNISLDNLESKIDIIEYPIVDISKMYVIEKENSINIYIVNGNVMNFVAKNSTPFSMIVKTDAKNNTFKIILDDYIKQKYGDLKVGDEFSINTEDSIKNLSYNTYINQVIEERQYVSDIYEIYVKNLLYNQEAAYNKLNSEYKDKRFPTFEEFKSYIIKMRSKFVSAEIRKYKVNEYENYIQYICIDSKDRYFIINEFAPMDYEVILDEYTIDLQEFIDKYQSSKEKRKIELNTKKIALAIEEQNYRYIYEKLNNEFKTNNFATYESFKNYCENSVINNLIISESSMELRETVYVVTFKSNNNEYFTILMRLTEDRNFEISFEVK